MTAFSCLSINKVEIPVTMLFLLHEVFALIEVHFRVKAGNNIFQMGDKICKA